jgi:hypothetical protein
MWILAMMAAVLAALLSPILASRPSEEHAISTARARALAESMAVYRSALVTWVQGQPGFEGVVTDTAVVGPAWFHRDPSIRAAVQGRIVAVYLADRPPAGVLDEMLSLSGSSIWVGIADRASGTLHSPGLGDTGLQVPQWVPDQSPVWLALRD